MTRPLDFYFDFASPYGYFASHRIDEIAARHGRSVTWRPYLLGAAFKITGWVPAVNVPLKRDYVRRDIERSARRFGLPLTLPEGFPHMTLAAGRAYYWLFDQDADKAKALARALFHAYFGEGRDVSPPETVADVAETIGLDREAVLAAVGDQTVKGRFRAATDQAIERGAFGSPFIFVDGEPFWGSDRLDHIDRWLETGGW